MEKAVRTEVGKTPLKQLTVVTYQPLFFLCHSIRKFVVQAMPPKPLILVGKNWKTGL